MTPMQKNSREAKTNTLLLVVGRYLNVKKDDMTENHAENIWRSLERRFFQQPLILGLLRLRLMTWLR